MILLEAGKHKIHCFLFFFLQHCEKQITELQSKVSEQRSATIGVKGMEKIHDVL